MTIEPGRELLHYRIVDKIGEGGMGAVWKAVDTALDREVAIKVLPELFSADAERMARFDREAKTLAAINHPSIAGIYGLHEVDGLRFIAMEYVGGEDLTDRIARGAMVEADALEIAAQIAQALETAHEQGIVHRDLKPANIRVNAEGQVKVLDFGLAKALDPTSSQPGSDALGLSPTMTSAGAAGTMAGTILGTAGYMSPEQAKGKPVDRRADIWAFGVVLYEMLTGRRLYESETISETLAAVLLSAPDFAALPDSVSPNTRWLLQRCLTKEPKQRLRDIGEARLATENPESWTPTLPASTGEAVEGAAVAGSFLRSRTGVLVTTLVVAIVASVAFLVGMLAGGEEQAPLPLRKFEISRDGVNRSFDNPPTLSPDGQRIVYVHEDAIWLRDFAQLEPRKLVEPGDTPFWSADGRSIAYENDKKLWRIPITGGQPSLICELPERGNIVSGVWARDGTIWVATWRGGIYRVSARGGDPQLALAIAADEVDFHDLWLLPDQHSVMMVNHMANPDTGEWVEENRIIVLRDGERHEVIVDPGVTSVSTPVYSRGHLLYRREDTAEGIWAVPFSPEKLETTGEPFLLVAGARTPSVADDGTLTYLPDTGADAETIQLVWFDRTGRELARVGPPRKMHHRFALSPDGSKIVVSIERDSEQTDLWVHDADGRGGYPLTREPGRESLPTWSADGNTIYYNASAENCRSLRCITIAARAADGSGSPTVLGSGGFHGTPTLDESAVLFTTFTGGAGAGLTIMRQPLDADAGEPAPLFEGSKERAFPSFSPDGRFIAYTQVVGFEGEADSQVVISSYPDLSMTLEVTRDGGAWPTWSADGDRLYYLDQFDLMEVEVTREPRLRAGTPQRLFALQEHRFDSPEGGLPTVAVAADGQRFLTTRVELDNRAARGIVVVQNWVREYASP